MPMTPTKAEARDVEQAMARIIERLGSMHAIGRAWTTLYELREDVRLLLSEHERQAKELDDAKRSRDDAVGRCVEAQGELERLRGLIVAFGVAKHHHPEKCSCYQDIAAEARAIRESKPE